MLRLKFSSTQLKCLFLLFAILLLLPAKGGSTPVARQNNSNLVSRKTLARMMIPGTQDLQLIVELSDPGVLEKMRANSTQLASAAKPSERHRRIDVNSQQALEWRQQILQNKEGIKNKILQFSGAQIVGTTEVAMNAVFVRVPATHYDAIKKLSGVKKVYFSRPRKMLLDQAATLQNAQGLWNAESNAGSGIKIGIIDSGIDKGNAMFSDSGMSAPSGFPKYDTTADQAYTNAKIIVARSFVSDLYYNQSVTSAVDEVGHGTFVAGCAAGKSVSAPLATISGMAPGAYLGSYKIFGTPGTNDYTTSAAIIDAIDWAIKDGMDVINLSLGGLDYVPPADDTSGEVTAIENAISSGVVVVIAAGNEGSATHTISTPGTANDAITVGAVTNSREFAPIIQTNDSNLSTIGYAPSYDGVSVTSTVSGEVVDAGNGCTSYTSSAGLSGSIALIVRGACNFSVKGANAQAAGAKAVIVYNNTSSGLTTMTGLSSVTIPVVMISNSDGLSLKQYVDANSGSVQVSIQNSSTLQSVATIPREVTYFSSVGPNMDFTVKPDMVAVGQDVYSAATTRTTATMYNSTGFTIGSGTSFSTPMVTGAAAALRQHFTTLGPLAIKSLLTTTATRNVTVDGTNAASVLQAGSGLLNMGNAYAATAVFSPTSLSFGAHSYSGSYTSSLSLEIENITSSSDQFTLGVEELVSGASITFDKSSVSLGAKSTATITVTISVTAPNSSAFQGFVTAKSSNTSFIYRIPYWAGLYIPNTTTVLPVSQSASGSFTSLADAINAAQPGNIVEIQDSSTYSTGSSSLVITTNSQGLPLHGITIRAASSQTPVIDGSALGSSGSPADILIIGLQNVLLQGLTINGGYWGIELYQPATDVPLSVTVDQSTITNTSGDSAASGIWIDQGGVVDVTNSTISNSDGPGIAAGVYNSGTQLTVLNSTIQGNGDYGLYAYGTNLDIFNSSITGNYGPGLILYECSGTIKGNTIAQNQGYYGSSGYINGDGLDVGDGNLIIQNNLIDSNDDFGLFLSAAIGSGPTAKVLANTIRGNGYYGLVSYPVVSLVADGNLIEDNYAGVYLRETPSASLTNNIIVRSTSNPGVVVLTGTGDSIATNARIINDTIYQNSLYGVYSSGATTYIANSIVYANGTNVSGVSSSSIVSSLYGSSDPKFTSASSNDFSLQSSSPAINTGTNSVQGLPFLDYSGKLRVDLSSGKVDIGAVEYNSKYPLVYPLVANGSQPSIGGTFTTGIAILNPNNSSSQVNLTAYTGSGSPLSAYGQNFGVENQLAALYYQLFGFDSNAAEMGSVLAASDLKPVGFSLIFDPAFSLFSTGANATAQTGTDLVFMRHESDANGTANYVVTNPGVNTANVTATLYSTAGLSIGQKTATIVPKGQMVFNFNSSTLSSGYVRVKSDQPLSGIETVGTSNRQAALGAFSPGSEARLFFPHYAVGGGYTTHVGIVNSGASAANLTLAAYGNDGNVLGSIGSIQIAAGGQFLGSVSDLFGISTSGAIQTGYLVAQSDQPGIMGYTDFTWNDGVHIADATLPADSVPSMKLLFSHVANGVPSGTGSPDITGIALLNPFGTAVSYTIAVYDKGGNLVAQASYTLGPHQKTARLLSYPDPNAAFFTQSITLGNGHIEVTSDYGLVGLELFFTQDVSQLASVPAQIQ